MLKKYTLQHGKETILAKFDPDDTNKYKNKEEVEEEFEKLQEKLRNLQDKLFASKKHAVLILFQGMDCSGKDGVIKKALSNLNPQGFRTESFKKPTEDELAHDFLWRSHKVLPQKGYICAFNRSYYEDVLITRVHKTITDKEAEKRMAHIRNFENLLLDNGVVLIKIFLHISKSFQMDKINERMGNPEKRWKFDPNDLQERQHWDQYVEAYENVFSQTARKKAPWYIVPANERWFRDFLVLQILVDTMERLNLTYPDVAIDMSNLISPIVRA